MGTLLHAQPKYLHALMFILMLDFLLREFEIRNSN